MNLVFARFTKSAILYQQMRGRGTRKSKGKPLFTMFDFVGVTDYHGDEDEHGEGGIVVARQAAQEANEPRALLSLDINDHIDPTTREWITVDENGNMVFPEASEAKAAALGARFEAWLLGREEFTPDQERWLRHGRQPAQGECRHLDEFTAGHFAFAPVHADGRPARGACGSSGATSRLTRCSSRSMGRSFQPAEPTAATRPTATDAHARKPHNEGRQQNAPDPRDAPLDRSDPRLPVSAAAIPIRSAMPSSSRSCSSSI